VTVCACSIRPVGTGPVPAATEDSLGPDRKEAGIGFPAPGKPEAHYGNLYRPLGLEASLPYVLDELANGEHPGGREARRHSMVRPVMRERGYCEECIDRALYGRRHPDVLITEANDMADGINRDHSRWTAARMLAEHAAGSYNAYQETA
jgi:hypothetical protein